MVAPRVKEELDARVTKGLLAIINARIDENLFGLYFSADCPDSKAHSVGCDEQKLQNAVKLYDVVWPKDWPTWDGKVPTDAQLFDLIEFLWEHAGLPKAYEYHGFFSHDHLSYDQDAGRAKFAEYVNRAF